MISFRTSKEEKMFLKRYAEERNLNLSKFIKKAVFKAIEDEEDYIVAEEISKLVKEGKVSTKSLSDFESEMNSNV